MFHFTSIEKYHVHLGENSITCEQTVQHYLLSIEKHKHLNAYIEVFENEALERAIFLDTLPPHKRGPLYGVVVSLKDNICYKGHKVSAASAILGGFTSLYSATAVERLLQAGAIIIGRTNCDEFGMGSTNENSVYGPVLNPNNEEHVAGGSSGGSAAAVKAGLCMVSLGSDTGGSVRLPADFCGVVGLKPTYGRISRHGLIAYGSSFDQIGILGNTVEDVAKVLEVIAGNDEFDSTVSQNPVDQFSNVGQEKQQYRIGYFPEWLDHPSIDPEISKNIKDLVEKLKVEGHQVQPLHFDLTEYIVPAYYVLTTAEASSNLSRYDGIRYGAVLSKAPELKEFYKETRSKGFGLEVKRRIILGSFVLSTGYYDAYFTKAQQVRKLLQQKTQLIFNEIDFIVAPNAPSTAYKVGKLNHDPIAMYLGDIFTVFANLTGIPAISLPVFKHSNNLPFGLQVLSSRFNEVSLLRFSHHLMQQ